MRTFLLTGATGLVGSYLLKDLACKGYKVYVIARNKLDINATNRVKNAVQFWFDNPIWENIIVLEGDVTCKNLGLNMETVAILSGEVDQIVHAAALTDFNASLEQLRKVNVEGTENVLNLAVFLSKHGKLKKVNYFSTIYLFGDYSGTFDEEKTDVHQKFDIPYERSKLEAEKIVATYREKNLWVDIFRIPAVLGESTSGKLPDFKQAFYQGLRILNFGIFEELPCNDLKCNVIFVDQLSAVFMHIIDHIDVRNNCFHLFKEEPLSIKEFLLMASKVLRQKPPDFYDYYEISKKRLTSVQKTLIQFNYTFLARPSTLSSRRTNDLLKMSGWTFEKNDSPQYFENIVNYAVNKGFLHKK